MLDDGTYDAIVIDVDEPDDERQITVEVTILAGEHKGAVISLQTTALTGDPLDLLAVPATITVVDGEPRVHFEP